MSKKKTVDVPKKDSMMSIPATYSAIKCLAFPTSSREMITSVREETRKKKKPGGKSFISTLSDDADAAALKAYEALSVDDLSPLMARLPMR